MNKYNTKLRQMLSLVGRPQFEKCVMETGADFAWAEFRSTVGGVKVHLKYDINNYAPDYLFISLDEKTGNAITILTNIFNLTAEYVAKMYRARTR